MAKSTPNLTLEDLDLGLSPDEAKRLAREARARAKTKPGTKTKPSSAPAPSPASREALIASTARRLTPQPSWKPEAQVLIINRFVCACGHITDAPGATSALTRYRNRTGSTHLSEAKISSALPKETLYRAHTVSACPECWATAGGTTAAKVQVPAADIEPQGDLLH